MKFLRRWKSRLAIVGEFWDYMRHRKTWWLAPVIVVLVILSIFIALTSGSVLAPFIYTLF